MSFLKRPFVYRSELRERGMFNMPTLFLFADLDGETEEHRAHYEQAANGTRAHVQFQRDALGWITFFRHPELLVWVIREIQSDVLCPGAPACVENRYKYWHRWALWELARAAQVEGVESVYIPTALQVYTMWYVLPRLERKAKRSDPRVYGCDVEKRCQLFRRLYDETAELAGAEVRRVSDDAVGQRYLRYDETRMLVERMHVFEVNEFLKKVA